MRKDLYSKPQSSAYAKTPKMAHLPTAEEFAEANEYVEQLNDEQLKFSNTETGEPIAYLDPNSNSNSTITLAHSFVNYQNRIYAIYVYPGTLEKKLLKQRQKPPHVPQEQWDAEFQFAEAQLSGKANFTKLPKAQKIVRGYSFWKMSDGAYAQMRSRTCLGMGTYGVAKLLVNEQGKKCVVKKQYLLSDSDRDDFEKERNFSLKIGLALDSFIDDAKNKAFLFMPFYPHTLGTYVDLLSQEMSKDPKNTSMNWELLLNLLIKLIDELCWIHFDHGIIHRDIKMDNIFVTEDGKVKLGDLGLAETADQSGRFQSTHSWGGEAPLHYSSEAAYQGLFSFASDIFALGVVYRTCFEALSKTRCLPTLDRRVNDDFHELIIGMMLSDDSIRLPHEYIKQTLLNILAIVKGEIDLPAFIETSNDLKINLRMYQMFGISFDKLHTGEEKLYIDPFLEDQFFRTSFERDFFRTDEITAKIKEIFRYYYDALKYTQDHEVVLSGSLFADSILAKKERCVEIKKEISQSRLFSFEDPETITAERLSVLLGEVKKIDSGEKKPTPAPLKSSCAVS